MTSFRACALVTAAFLLFSGSATARPFTQNSNQQSQPKTPEPVTGELVSVDPDKRTIVVRTADEAEMKFSFSAQTEIIGADKGAAGLATTKNATVTVTYNVHGTANVATKIEVLPKK